MVPCSLQTPLCDGGEGHRELVGGLAVVEDGADLGRRCGGREVVKVGRARCGTCRWRRRGGTRRDGVGVELELGGWVGVVEGEDREGTEGGSGGANGVNGEEGDAVAEVPQGGCRRRGQARWGRRQARRSSAGTDVD